VLQAAFQKKAHHNLEIGPSRTEHLSDPVEILEMATCCTNRWVASRGIYAWESIQYISSHVNALKTWGIESFTDRVGRR
jgi:hypothetical protein